MRNNLDKELEIVKAEVQDYNFKNFESTVVQLDDKYYIGINKNLSELDRFWILEHELEHIKNHTLYNPDDDNFTINQKERITNDAMILKLGLPAEVYKLLKAGLNKDEIMSRMKITESVFDYTYTFIIRNYLKFMGGNKNEK